MSSSFGAELRIDNNDGNPYTLQSFLETYPNGQELWDAAEVWKSDGVLRIRTAPMERNHPEPTPNKEVSSSSVSPAPEFNNKHFPSISPAPIETKQNSKTINYAGAVASSEHTHYTNSLSPYSGDSDMLSPEAQEFRPDNESSSNIRYTKHHSSTNEDFETLPMSLWNGTEQYVQPIEDVENGCIDWEMMIQTWTAEQWREFGIKYFYGYVQQSSLLMSSMPATDGDDCCNGGKVLGAWGDE